MFKVRRLILALALAASLAITASVLADSLNFNTHLSGDQEVPINNSLGQISSCACGCWVSISRGPNISTLTGP